LFLLLAAGAALAFCRSSATAADIPKGYEVVERTSRRISGLACCFRPARGRDRRSIPAKLARRLEPFTVIQKLNETGFPEGVTTSLEVEWHGSEFVAIYEFRKWGIIDLRLYELAGDQVKREHPSGRKP
jgi:hypothetical protein